MSLEAVWHDVECGSYAEDVELWRMLAAEAGGPILDVGAGTGRVTLDLAARGHDVVALDVSDDLLCALRARAAARGLTVRTICCDARELDDQERFAAVLVPMQTLQLLGGPEGRARFCERVAAHLRPGGLVAAALADALEAFDEEHTRPPLPDMLELDGVLYASRPLSVQEVGDGVVIHRLRETVDPDGRRTAEADAIKLDRVTPDEAARELAAAGLTVEAPLAVPQTHEYVGSTVVVARA
jgi:SAM-dependent methyltransferase